MYEFEKLNNEEIILISDNSILKRDDKEVMISTIITNKRMLLLDYPSNANNYQEVMKCARGMDYLKQKEVILAVELTNVLKIEATDNYNKYTLKNGNYFYLRDDFVKKTMEEILKN